VSRFEAVDAGAVDVSGDGVQWALAGSDDLNANLVALGPDGEIGEHVNDAVDVLVVVLAGAGSMTVEDDRHPLAAGGVVLVPRGARRRIDAGDDGLRYLTVHRRRGPLAIGPRR
jgi:quercetin dioxygenase-like cupin family protein